MKIARPEKEEINKAFKLLRALNDVSHEIDPMRTNKNEDDEPVWLEDKDKDRVLDHITELYESCNIEWLLAALETMLSPENKIIDDAADVLELHPDIIRGIADSKRLDWLSKQGAVGFVDAYDADYNLLPGKTALRVYHYIGDAEELGKGGNCRAAIDDAMSKEAV